MYAGRAFGAPAADEEITGDWFLMPAVVDRHVHIGLSDPRDVLIGGVTVVRDLGWPPGEIFPLADVSVGPEFDGPEIGTVGPMITAEGGYPTEAAWAPEGTALEIRGSDEARAAVERVADEGAVAVKVALNSDAGPTLADAELVTICEAAHARRLPVVAHVQGTGQAERALGAGVDEFAHCPWSEELTDDLIEAMAKSMRIVSTLDIHSYGVRTPELERAVSNLFRFLQAGGRVLYGTDLGNGPIPAGIHVREAQEMSLAQMSNEGILGAMTGWRLAAESRGDLIALRGNPLSDLGALADLEVVVRAGRVRRGSGSGS